MFSAFGQTVSTLEFVAFVTGLASVWLTKRMHVANWPVGLVNVACFAVLFVGAKLYADAALQVAFFVLGLYGWWTWAHDNRTGGTLLVSRASRREAALALILAVGGTLAVAQALHLWTDSPVAVPDAAILVLSLLATWAQARRRLESWSLWIVVDVISIPLYWSRALPLTAVLYVIFLAICFAGFASWKGRVAPARGTA